MLARRFFASAISGPSATRQGVRTATSWASPCRPPSTSLSTDPTSNTKSQPSTSGVKAKTSGGRHKPSRPAVQVRTTPRPRLSTTFFTSTPSTLTADLSRLVSTLTSSPPPRKTQGRRRRSSTHSISPSTRANGLAPGDSDIFSQCQNPLPTDYSFHPIPLYPHRLQLHMAFTPAHQPIMANLGTGRYLQPPSKHSIQRLANTAETPFDLPSRPSPVRALQKGLPARDTAPNGLPILSTGSTSLGDHLSVMSALSHPSNHHHLVSPPTHGYTSEDPETQLLRMMAEADMKHQLNAEWAFDAALAKLGDKEAVANAASAVKEGDVQAEGSADAAQMNEVLKGLDGVLAKLALGDGAEEARGRSKENVPLAMGKGVTVEVKVIRVGEGEGLEALGKLGNLQEMGIDLGMGEELGVMLDSVKRKRKKKISKHKYQKRRKATRAQRKRLGK